MCLKLFFSRIRLFFDEDMRNQLKKRKKFESMLQKLTSKKSNLIKNINSKESIDINEELRIIDMLITKANAKLKNEFDNKLVLC